MPPMNPWLEQSCEEIDAGIFSSDLLWIEERRNLLKRYIARWQRAIDEHEKEALRDINGASENKFQ